MSRSPEAMLSMFRSGLDTYAIAKRLNVKEAVVSRHIWVARCQELGRPADFIRDGSIKRIEEKHEAA